MLRKAADAIRTDTKVSDGDFRCDTCIRKNVPRCTSGANDQNGQPKLQFLADIPWEQELPHRLRTQNKRATRGLEPLSSLYPPNDEYPQGPGPYVPQHHAQNNANDNRRYAQQKQSALHEQALSNQGSRRPLSYPRGAHRNFSQQNEGQGYNGHVWLGANTAQFYGDAQNYMPMFGRQHAYEFNPSLGNRTSGWGQNDHMAQGLPTTFGGVNPSNAYNSATPGNPESATTQPKRKLEDAEFNVAESNKRTRTTEDQVLLDFKDEKLARIRAEHKCDNLERELAQERERATAAKRVCQDLQYELEQERERVTLAKRACQNLQHELEQERRRGGTFQDIAGDPVEEDHESMPPPQDRGRDQNRDRNRSCRNNRTPRQPRDSWGPRRNDSRDLSRRSESQGSSSNNRGSRR